jgi:hypothetical protein
MSSSSSSRLQHECDISPSYFMLTNLGQLPCKSFPLLSTDLKGWQTVRRCIKSCRRQHCRSCERGLSRHARLRTDDELEQDADLSNWDNVEHYGRATYTTANTFEHNGSLFDIGSRF